MSTARNHAKRSHRSEFRARPYHEGARQTRGGVTARRRGVLDIIRRMMRAVKGGTP